MTTNYINDYLMANIGSEKELSKSTSYQSKDSNSPEFMNILSNLNQKVQQVEKQNTTETKSINPQNLTVQDVPAQTNISTLKNIGVQKENKSKLANNTSAVIIAQPNVNTNTKMPNLKTESLIDNIQNNSELNNSNIETPLVLNEQLIQAQAIMQEPIKPAAIPENFILGNTEEIESQQVQAMQAKDTNTLSTGTDSTKLKNEIEQNNKTPLTATNSYIEDNNTEITNSTTGIKANNTVKNNQNIEQIVKEETTLEKINPTQNSENFENNKVELTSTPEIQITNNADLKAETKVTDTNKNAETKAIDGTIDLPKAEEKIDLENPSSAKSLTQNESKTPNNSDYNTTETSNKDKQTNTLENKSVEVKTVEGKTTQDIAVEKYERPEIESANKEKISTNTNFEKPEEKITIENSEKVVGTDTKYDHVENITGAAANILDSNVNSLENDGVSEATTKRVQHENLETSEILSQKEDNEVKNTNSANNSNSIESLLNNDELNIVEIKNTTENKLKTEILVQDINSKVETQDYLRNNSISFERDSITLPDTKIIENVSDKIDKEAIESTVQPVQESTSIQNVELDLVQPETDVETSNMTKEIKNETKTVSHENEQPYIQHHLKAKSTMKDNQSNDGFSKQQNASEQIVKMSIVGDTHSATSNDFGNLINQQQNTLTTDKISGQISTPSQDTSLNKLDILNQINERMSSIKTSQSEKIEIILQPANLGKVNIELESVKGALTATLVADSQQVKEILEKNVDSLKNNLTSQGVNVNNVIVKVEEPNKSSHSGMNFDQNQFQSNQNQNNNQQNNQNQNYMKDNYRNDSLLHEATKTDENESSNEVETKKSNTENKNLIDYKV